MSLFRFNFGSDNCNAKQDSLKLDSNVLIEDNQCIQWLPSEEILPTKQINDLDSIVLHAKMFTCGEIEIGHVMPNEVKANINANNISGTTGTELTEHSDHSDLVTGKYEGGLKIWECTYDLIEYISQNQQEINLENANVLDLGCGAGIVGIYAHMNGSYVTFQDYNKEVIENVTIPNLLLNIEEEDRQIEIKKCKFYSGDWESFNELLPDSTLYDVIFSAETIYNESNYKKLLDLFLKRLKNKGVIYLAAKTYYFGVGGGLRQFETSIKKTEMLKSEICFRSHDGIQREILKITKKC